MPIILKEIPASAVIEGERFRQDYGNLSDLIESFKHEGIIQPLAVRDNEDGTYLLLAGGRRYAAVKKAGIETIPVRCYPATLSDLEMRSIELMENICRKDLDWIETAKLKREIHLLQVAIYGEKKSTSPGAPGWSKRDTADLLGVSKDTVFQDIILAEAVERFPDLAKAKNRSEANKILGNLQEDIIRKELAQRIEAKTATTPIDRIHQGLINQYIVKDFFSGVKEIPNGSVDFIELDPPYAIDLNKQKRDMKTGYSDNYNEVDKAKYYDFMLEVLQQCNRVMTSNSWMLLWHAKEWRTMLVETLTILGLVADEGMWYKGQAGQTNSPSLHLASSFEPFLYVRKGSPSIIRQGRSNVFHYKPVSSTKKIHPTERPIELIQDAIQTFCWEGARIMVPFLGSGNTILAASNLGMTAFGWDLSQEYKNAFTVNVAAGRPGSYHSHRDGEGGKEGCLS